jgi:DNA-directed RNA polymerase specialized sigma54-like protein
LATKESRDDKETEEKSAEEIVEEVAGGTAETLAREDFGKIKEELEIKKNEAADYLDALKRLKA